AAILLHVNANSVSNAVFEPVKTFNYMALPYQALAQVRMLVEGAVYPAGIALSGFVLLWLQATVSTPLILLVAIVLAFVFLGAAATTGTSFLPSLMLCLRLRPLAPSEFPPSARRRCGTRFSKSDIRHLLTHPDADARRFGQTLAACAAPELLPRVPLPTSACPPAPSMLAAAGRALEDNDRANRRRAVELLAQSGDAAVPIARERLKSERAEVVSAAIEVLGGIGTRRARRALEEYVRTLCEQGRLNLAASAALQQLGCSKTLSPEDANLLAAAFADSNQRIVRRILDVKAAVGHRRNVNFLRSLANAHEPRIRSNAIEALASLPTGYLLRRVISLLDAEPSAFERGYRRALAASPTTPLWRAAAEDRWVRALAIRLFGPSEGMDLDARDEAMLDLVLFLRTVPLLRGFSFEDLANLAEGADVLTVPAGASIIETGDRVTHLILVQHGSVELHLDGSVVETLLNGACIGEAAIVGGQVHTVAARAVSDAILLRFPATTFSDIFAEHPQLLTTVLDDLLRRMGGVYTNLARLRRPKEPLMDVPADPLPGIAGRPRLG
ncbi:MAG: HEAT repeat domain-containing protein, partial [Rhodospirillales bacterium]